MDLPTTSSSLRSLVFHLHSSRCDCDPFIPLLISRWSFVRLVQKARGLATASAGFSCCELCTMVVVVEELAWFVLIPRPFSRLRKSKLMEGGRLSQNRRVQEEQIGSVQDHTQINIGHWGFCICYTHLFYYVRKWGHRMDLPHLLIEFLNCLQLSIILLISPSMLSHILIFTV